MRTTITLEDDVARALAALQRARAQSFKDTVNAVLRAGLATAQARPASARLAYRTETVSLGAPRLTDLDDVCEVLAFGVGLG